MTTKLGGMGALTAARGGTPKNRNRNRDHNHYHKLNDNNLHLAVQTNQMNRKPILT